MDESLKHATLIATLAERFNLTSLKPFQKTVIDATLNGQDTLVIQPTGSGKSICFQFPPIYLNKKAIIVTPTISLMQHQVHKLNGIGIQSVLLGSAQLDKQVEIHALQPDSKEQIIFVTPEWIAKSVNQMKLHSLIRSDKLALIAIDEAHLFNEWNDFRSAFSELRRLKSEFPSIPLMALTATATAAVKDEIKLLLRNPVVSQSSMNRPNVTLKVEELEQDKSKPQAVQFASKAAEIIGSGASIIYTDFIADIGPIVSALQEVGVEAVGYHGEMDIPTRQESYLKWKSGEVRTIVATKAFGMGIDKADIRHVIRNGVPESMLSWAQELGRAGRDGQQACATILYRKSDISHANSWILNNLSDQDKCKRILAGFSDSWRYVNAHLSGTCRRRLLMGMFDEESSSSDASGDCCDVCIHRNSNETEYTDHKEELQILLDALSSIGCKGEVKIAEWIRGSKLQWTDAFNKECLSYGNHKNKDMTFWRTFIKQCHVMSLVQLELKSMIKGSGLYAVNGIYFPTQSGMEVINSSEPLMLPRSNSAIDEMKSTSAQASISGNGLSIKKKRLGKGSNILTVVRKLLTQPENWLTVEDKKSYHYPGVLPKPMLQQLFYIENASSLQQSCEDPDFIWKDIRLSKGQLNRDRLITVEIGCEKEEVFYRSAPCLGVKYCPQEGCSHIVPIRDKRACPNHNTELQKTFDCPVEFVYIHPKNSSDNRRWFGGIVRSQKAPIENLHNHKIHGSTKIAQCVKEKINNAISANPALTPSEIACGKGIGFIPSAVDQASSHTGKVSQEIRRTKVSKGLNDKNWSPMSFEKTADEIDDEDDQISGSQANKYKYTNYGRPYLVASGFEEGIKYIFTMSPIMAKVASEADFIQCDITYDDCRDYPYIFNAVAFNKVSMEWMVVARLRLDAQTASAYALAFKKVFEKCKSYNKEFELGSTLQGIITDWSDAEISGLKIAIGKNLAETLLKGCKVHWKRSCQRVAEKVSTSRDKTRERDIFMKISSRIQTVDSAVTIVACFESLCGVRSVSQLLKDLPGLCSTDDAKFIDDNCDWSTAKHWCQWWARRDHLIMLSRAFSKMDEIVWKQCPSTTNAVERRNKDCKSDTPQCLKLAMIKVYKVDKIACLKHIAAEDGVSLSYRSQTEEARRVAAAKKSQQRMKLIPDKTAQFGPPDRTDNFVVSSSRKRTKLSSQEYTNSCSAPKRQCQTVDNSRVECIPNQHPEVMGKRVRMRFEEETGEQWYEGIISSYNIITGKYSIYFPCDGQTEEASFDDDDMEIIN